MERKNVFIVCCEEAAGRQFYQDILGSLVKLGKTDPRYDFYPAGSMNYLTTFAYMHCEGLSLVVRHKQTADKQELNILRLPPTSFPALKVKEVPGRNTVLFCFDMACLKKGFHPLEQVGGEDSPVFKWMIVELLHRSAPAARANLLLAQEEQLDAAGRQLLHSSNRNGHWLDGHRAAAWINEGKADVLAYHPFLNLPTLVLPTTNCSLKPLTI